MASVGEDIAREILLKLPTRDLVRSSCVCKLWRDIVRDPAFRTLHGNASHVVSGSGIEAAESLVVPEFGGCGVGLEMTVLNGTSWKPMCRFTELAPGYSPTNACNGFLLLGSGVPDWPVYVCNPVTGEKLKIPAPPEIEQVQRRTYALGFSPSTRLYKLFCLSFPRTGWPETHDCYLEVCTFGAGAGDGKWRRHKNSFRAEYNLRPLPPVLVDGKLYVVIEGPERYRARDRMLVIDVASEMHDTYWLPREITGLDEVAVYAFNLSGPLCVAIRVIGRRRVNFWVMLSLRSKRMDWRMPQWERRYTFYMDADGEYGDKPSCAWLDCRDGMLCYRFGDRVYKYDTKKKRPKRRIQLPAAPFASPDDQHQRWNAYGGYRPSLLSPHIAFASSPSLLQQHREKQEQYEHTLSHALGCQHPSKKRCSTCPPCCSNNHLGAKRIRSSQPHN